MKAIITFILFFFFLLIRSGNSHEIINSSDKPVISFMGNHTVNEQNMKTTNSFHPLKFTEDKSNGLGGNNNQIVLDQDSEDFQLWKDYQIQMAFFACLIAFTFLLVLSQKLLRNFSEFLQDSNSTPIFITQRSLRI